MLSFPRSSLYPVWPFRRLPRPTLWPAPQYLPHSHFLPLYTHTYNPCVRREMICAGYCCYGSATELVITYGKGVQRFTLDPSLGEFILTAENLTLPEVPTPHTPPSVFPPPASDSSAAPPHASYCHA
jgi:Fructose-1-6-bisphosphatase, N-terminal domain